MHYFLHIDTSSDVCSVSISKNGLQLTRIDSTEARNHASALNLMISDSLTRVNISFSDIAAIAVCEGPGSYTGLRIAMATAKGICYATGIHLILIDKLTLLAYDAHKKNVSSGALNFATILTAREKEYFIAIYNNENKCLVAPTHTTEADIATLLHEKENLHIVSDAPIETFYQLKVNFRSFGENIRIDHQSWAEYAYLQFKREEFANVMTSTPLYLKQAYTHK